jgi:hypothetical protein
LRGQQFLILKSRRVSGHETLILQGSPDATFAVPAAWTDWAAPDAELASATLLSVRCLQSLATLVGQLERPAAVRVQKGVAK